MPLVYDPHYGGIKIPERTKVKTRERILAYAEQHYHGKYLRLDIRFRKQFCYIDAYIEPMLSDDFPPPGWHETREEALERMRSHPMHLCRLRHFTEERWSVAYYSYKCGLCAQTRVARVEKNATESACQKCPYLRKHVYHYTMFTQSIGGQ